MLHSTQRININTVTDYMNLLPDNVYLSLENIRQIIKTLVPDAAETISDKLPTYMYKGVLVGFGASKNQCSFFVKSPALLKKFKEEVSDFDTATNAIHFTPDKPIPNELIIRIVLARVAENDLNEKKNKINL